MPIKRYIYNPQQPIIDAVLYDGDNIAEIEELTGTTSYTITPNWDGAGNKIVVFDDYKYPYLYQGFWLIRAIYPHYTQWSIADGDSFDLDYDPVTP